MTPLSTAQRSVLEAMRDGVGLESCGGLAYICHEPQSKIVDQDVFTDLVKKGYIEKSRPLNNESIYRVYWYKLTDKGLEALKND